MSEVLQEVSFDEFNDKIKLSGTCCDEARWVEKLPYGAEVSILSKTALKKNAGDMFPAVEHLSGKKIKLGLPNISKLNMSNGLYVGTATSTVDGCQIDFPLAWVKQPPQIELEPFDHYSIESKVSDNDVEVIIKEMKDSVDKMRLKKMIKSAMKYKKMLPSDNAIDVILDKWARSKIHFYLMFGRSLTSEKEFRFTRDDSEIGSAIDDLMNRYPLYAPIIARMTLKQIADNKISLPTCATALTYSSPCGNSIDLFGAVGISKSNGTIKVSSLFSKLSSLSGNGSDISEFISDLSMISNIKDVIGKLVVSIDPYDYITASTNKHGWTSCACPFTNQGGWLLGNNARTSFSPMFDNSTVVAYRTTDKEYTYSFDGVTWTGNSKSWRQFVHIDKMRGTMMFNRSYPANGSTNIAKEASNEVRLHLEALISDYLKRPNIWINTGNLKDVVRHDGMSYDDTVRNNIVVVFPQGEKISPSLYSFGLTSFNTCLICGSDTDGAFGICTNCQ